ncbi:uncharacterized protein LOC133312241 [Gastrolobium bilobum]|uniref:uncharacterized protein LOC133312241 n=1 Tax=Gastrolobium bilobum TaxID=150636 RepID=UPI002AAF7B95|nr:uncharacterized protein LOC133312241 [Gastrolobium bilobum]
MDSSALTYHFNRFRTSANSFLSQYEPLTLLLGPFLSLLLAHVIRSLFWVLHDKRLKATLLGFFMTSIKLIPAVKSRVDAEKETEGQSVDEYFDLFVDPTVNNNYGNVLFANKATLLFVNNWAYTLFKQFAAFFKPWIVDESSVEKCVSEEFEAGGHRWSLSIYPTGNLKEDGQDHVSIYLVLMNPSSSPLDWEVNAIVNFSVYNFLTDEYVATQDATVRRFHVLKTECGIQKFVDIDKFKDPSNGYLIDDTCVFGVEVFVVKTINKGDCLSMIQGPVTYSYIWKFNNFSTASSDMYESESFVRGNYKWKLRFYPNGNGMGKGNSISLFLAVEVLTLPPNTKLLVDYTLRAKDQMIGGQHVQRKACRKFSNPSSTWGYKLLVALAKFKNPNRGFLVNDSCILEAEFKVLGLTTLGID